MIPVAFVLASLMVLTAGIKLTFRYLSHRSITPEEDAVYQACTYLIFALGVTAGAVSAILFGIHFRAWDLVGIAAVLTVLCLIWVLQVIRRGGFKVPR